MSTPNEDLKLRIQVGQTYIVNIGGSQKKALAISGSVIYPDHWYFEDLVTEEQFLVPVSTVLDDEPDSQ